MCNLNGPREHYIGAMYDTGIIPKILFLSSDPGDMNGWDDLSINRTREKEEVLLTDLKKNYLIGTELFNLQHIYSTS